MIFKILNQRFFSFIKNRMNIVCFVVKNTTTINQTVSRSQFPINSNLYHFYSLRTLSLSLVVFLRPLPNLKYAFYRDNWDKEQ